MDAQLNKLKAFEMWISACRTYISDRPYFQHEDVAPNGRREKKLCDKKRVPQSYNETGQISLTSSIDISKEEENTCGYATCANGLDCYLYSCLRVS